ncbi:hypothetical protein [Deinococcus pimensis]|uniref:hypothetical protein n=1 Tax=Deinococcus pimensis TaxID=309888 RepID=UPI000481104B|nr:hypothetical protein [Deinococcus pimensis]
MKAVISVLLVVLGLCLAPLSLAAFASVNPNVSDVLRFLSVVEGAFSASLRLASVDAFWRGLTYLLLCVACVWAATYVKPRA